MKTVCIVQARIGSTRLPGKVMEFVGDRPVITHVLEKCCKIPGVDDVVCAIPDTRENDVLGSLVEFEGYEAVYGSETDVLARTYQAALYAEADVVMRVTSDCPLIDPELCGEVLALQQEYNAEYASNVHPRSYPKGLDCEVMTIRALRNAYKNATSYPDREHVTSYIVGQDITKLNQAKFPKIEGRWTLDYPEDLDFIRAVYENGDPSSMEATLDILKKNPWISEINERYI